MHLQLGLTLKEYLYSTNAGGSAEVSRAYDRANSYYTLVGLPADEVVRLAAEKPGRYSLAEWEALLQVGVCFCNMLFFLVSDTHESSNSWSSSGCCWCTTAMNVAHCMLSSLSKGFWGRCASP